VYGELQKALRTDVEPLRQAFYRSHPSGTHDRVIRRATELANAFGTDELMFIFKDGAMPISTAKGGMRLFAKRAMPPLKQLKPQPLTANVMSQNHQSMTSRQAGLFTARSANRGLSDY
jgi:hypothetical protein